MKTILIIICLVNTTFALASNEQWDSTLISDTCSRELKEAVRTVKDSVNSKEKLIAIMPKTVGYQYFNITFKVLKNGIAVRDAFTYQFQYWTKDDNHKKCIRVEPMDLIL